MTKENMIAYVTAGVVAGAGIIASAVSYSKSKKLVEENNARFMDMEENLNKAAKRINKSIDDIAESTDVEISDALIKSAVNTAVDREANRQVSAATKIAVAEIRTEMNANIRREITGMYGDMKEEVNKEVMKQVGELDIREVRRDVIDGSKRDIKDKLDSEVKDALNRIDDARRDAEKRFEEIVDDAEEKIDDAVDKLTKDAKDKMTGLMNQNSESIAFMNDIYKNLRGVMK